MRDAQVRRRQQRAASPAHDPIDERAGHLRVISDAPPVF
jgi:hypothetical protein